MSNPNFSALCPSGPIRTGSQIPIRQSEIVGVIVHTTYSNKESPLDLLPHNSIGVNDCYIGIECIQLLTPNSDGTYYTPSQMNTLIALIKDIRMRHPTAKQLLGHEDINPLRRSSKSGGWDPGALRDKPWFDWKRVLIGIGDLPPEPIVEHDDTTNMSFF